MQVYGAKTALKLYIQQFLKRTCPLLDVVRKILHLLPTYLPMYLFDLYFWPLSVLPKYRNTMRWMHVYLNVFVIGSILTHTSRKSEFLAELCSVKTLSSALRANFLQIIIQAGIFWQRRCFRTFKPSAHPWQCMVDRMWYKWYRSKF
jgi:hypothetical protein